MYVCLVQQKINKPLPYHKYHQKAKQKKTQKIKYNKKGDKFIHPNKSLKWLWFEKARTYIHSTTKIS